MAGEGRGKVCRKERQERAGGSGESGGWLERSFVCRLNWPGHRGAAAGSPGPAPLPPPAPSVPVPGSRLQDPLAVPRQAPRCAALPRVAAAAGGPLLSRAPEPGLIFNPSLFGQRPIFLPWRNATEMRLTSRVISQTAT